MNVHSLLLFVAAFAGQAQAEEVHRVLYLADTGVVVLQIKVNVEGRGPKRQFESFVDTFLKDLDRNGDGVVSVAESLGRIVSAREVQFTPPSGSETAVANPALDANPKDGMISRDELLAYFKRIGLLPFSVRLMVSTDQDDTNPRPSMANADTESNLFRRLDVDEDKQLSADELSHALEVLGKLDRDNDETISLEELQLAGAQPRPNPRSNSRNRTPSPLPFVSQDSGESLPKIIRRIIEKYDSPDPAKSEVPSLKIRNQKLSRTELGLSDVRFTKLDADGDRQLDFAELRQFVLAPDPDVELSVDLTAGKVEVRDDPAIRARTTPDGTAHMSLGPVVLNVSVAASPEFDSIDIAKSLFASLDRDANGYLDKMEFTGEILLGVSFADMDLDRNETLNVDEVVEFVKPRFQIARHRVELTIAEQGRTLFAILDGDRDGRLSRRELRHIADNLALWDTNGDGRLAESEIPLQFRLVVQRPLPDQRLQTSANSMNDRERAVPPGFGWFRKMDRNRDGEISRREFLGELELFERLDRNHDGAIELHEAMLIKPE